MDSFRIHCVDGVTAAVWGVGTDRKFLPEDPGKNIYIIMREV